MTKLDDIEILGEHTAVISDLHKEHSGGCFVSAGIVITVNFSRMPFLFQHFGVRPA